MASSSKATEIRVGLITLVALVLLVAGVMWGKGAGIGVDHKRVTIEIDNAAGVSGGTSVYLYGVKIGQVVSVSAEDDGAEIVTSIERGVELHRDASAVIQVMELTGGKKVELDPGVQGEPVAGDVRIEGRNQADIGAIIAVAQDLVTNVGPLLRQADSALGYLTDLIGDKGLQRDIKTAANQLASASVDLNVILRENKGRISRTMASVENISGNLDGFLQRNGPGVERIIRSTNGITDDASEAIGEARALIARVDGLTRRLDSITVDLKHGDGTISRFLYSSQLADQVDSTMVAIRKFLEDIEGKGVNVNVGVGHK